MQTVFYESKSTGGFPMSVLMQDAAMKELGWVNGQRISEDQVFDAIAANARAFCHDMEQRRVEGLNAPDTARLEALCGYGVPIMEAV